MRAGKSSFFNKFPPPEYRDCKMKAPSDKSLIRQGELPKYRGSASHLSAPAMPKITALLHTYNDAPRIGRALDSLRACDEVLVIDHHSTDDTAKIARDHGATVKEGVPGVNPGVYAMDARHDWVLCLLPNEAVGEGLEASLVEWKDGKHEASDNSGKAGDTAKQCSFAVQVREESENGWKELDVHTRLVNRKNINWSGHLPFDDPSAQLLPGHLLRFTKP